MKNILFSLAAIYGIGVSTISAYGLFLLDMPALEYAVESKDQNAELRHRINVFADGTWLLLGNLITITALLGACNGKNKSIN